MDALDSRIQAFFPVSEQGNGEGGDDHTYDHPGRFYRNLTGPGGLAADDSQWESIEKPDSTGFQGMTTHVILRPSRILRQFDNRGWKSQVQLNVYELQEENKDVVAFDNLPHDDHGFHHGISVSKVGTSVAYPPYTLVRLTKVFEAGKWTAPVGRLLAGALHFPKWKNVGSARPKRGREIVGPQLAHALRAKTAFNQAPHFTDDDLAAHEFKGPNGTAIHHDDFICVDDTYWKPDVEYIRPNCRLLVVRCVCKRVRACVRACVRAGYSPQLSLACFEVSLSLLCSCVTVCIWTHA